MKDRSLIKQFGYYLKYDLQFSSLLFDYKNMVQRYRKENKVLHALKEMGASVIQARDLYMSLSKHNNKVCHIIGSGWSLNESQNVIDKKKSYVIGLNYAALSRLQFDLYFMEPDYCLPEVTNRYVNIIDDLVRLDKSSILMKNVYTCDGNKIGYLMDSYGNRVSFIHNVGISIKNRNNMKYWSKKLLKQGKKSIKQYKSTVITAIVIARNAGFKNIVMHGVDFGGKYFFDAEKYKHLRRYKPAKDEVYINHEETDSLLIHPTAKARGGIQYILPVIKNKFNDEGISLYCATHKSPSAKILPVYI